MNKCYSPKIAIVLLILQSPTIVDAQSTADSIAIQKILQEEVVSWNKSDAETYSRHFAKDGTFTNLAGLFFTGHKAFLDRHDLIFKGTEMRQNLVSLKFIRDDVAIVETLTWISGFSKSGLPPGTHPDEKGRLRTRLLQVMTKDEGNWKIVAYHNVDLKPGSPAPEPR